MYVWAPSPYVVEGGREEEIGKGFSLSPRPSLSMSGRGGGPESSGGHR